MDCHEIVNLSKKVKGIQKHVLTTFLKVDHIMEIIQAFKKRRLFKNITHNYYF